MKKILLIILLLPFFTVSQDLPVVLRSDSGCEGFEGKDRKKYIDRKGDTLPITEACSFCTDPVGDVLASSTLIDKSGRYNYDASNLGDADFNTAWVEGEDGYGIGEFIEFDVGGILLCLTIYNGHQKSIDLWKNNSRVKTFKVYRNNSPICFLELEDIMSGQSFSLEDVGGSDRLRFEIVEIYKGDKWKDVCVSDILITGI
jgi:hypothetical protein